MANFYFFNLDKCIFMNLKIGHLEFEYPWIQGPLAGYSHAAFRKNLWHKGKLAYACSEVLPATCVNTESHDHFNRFTFRSQVEKFLCYQLSGKCPMKLAKAAKILSNLGADLIDLNAGCPKPKIRKKGCGSALLDDLANLKNCIEAIKLASSCPVTVKIRLPKPDCIATTKYYIREIEQAGADAIIIHGRHWQSEIIMHEHYLAAGIAASKPIIINGDIKSIAEGKKLMADHNVQGFMISRQGFIQPWLYELTNVSNEEIASYIESHISGMLQFSSENTVLMQSRSIMHYYCKSMPIGLKGRLLEITFKAKNVNLMLKAITQAILAP